MPPLRVLVSVFTCHPGLNSGLGAGEDLLGWNLVKQIARFHEVWALTYAENRSGIEQSMRKEPIANAHFQYVDLPGWMRPLLRYQGAHQFYAYLWQINAYFAAKKLHARHRFHIFHHITYANDWMASFIGALLPIPYVRGPGGGAHRTPKGLEVEYSILGRIWERVRAPAQWLFRQDPFFIRGQDRARAILVCNPEARAQVPKKWSDKVEIFPVSGVSWEDMSLSRPADDGNGRFQVLSAGSLIKVKGFGLAIRAFREFQENREDVEFTIVGSGPQDRVLRSLVARSNLERKVRFLPSMPRVQLLSRMASCDVFLFPSLRDGGGTVVIEAMSMGKAVVCLDTGGPGSHITEDCGVKVAPTSPEKTVHDLAEALERLYLDQDLRFRLGNAAREKALRTYLWDRLGERVEKIYQRILGTRDPD
jgi:glycosyltransferase involved in cell wall biosynthesis